jgi:hypothetical protein
MSLYQLKLNPPSSDAPRYNHPPSPDHSSIAGGQEKGISSNFFVYILFSISARAHTPHTPLVIFLPY